MQIKSYCKCEDRAGGSCEIISWCSGLLSGWIIITKLGGNERRMEACYLLSEENCYRELLRAQETLTGSMNDDSWWIFLIITLSH